MSLLDCKKLGFGLMRLPKIGEEEDVEQVKEMVDHFLSHGFKYFDTAYGYDKGKSEECIKEALVDRYPRDSFYLATKLPAWAGAKNEEEAKQMFYTSLKRTGAGYFDFYLLHNLAGERTKVFDRFHIWDFVKERKEEGLVKHIGFSYHGQAEELRDILSKHPEVEFVQLQINYADWDDPTVQSAKNLEVCNEFNKPVIIMEPVKGGTLFNLPEKVSHYMTDYAKDASLASWAIRFAASQKGVMMVLSGMSNMEQMKDNVSYMDDFKPLRKEEYEVIENVQKALKAQPSIPCTACSYCTKDCPMQIAIPRIFSAYNRYSVFDDLKGAKGSYGFATRNNAKASECLQCGQCESVCPQQINIIERLQEIAGLFEE